MAGGPAGAARLDGWRPWNAVEWVAWSSTLVVAVLVAVLAARVWGLSACHASGPHACEWLMLWVFAAAWMAVVGASAVVSLLVGFGRPRLHRPGAAVPRSYLVVAFTNLVAWFWTAVGLVLFEHDSESWALAWLLGLALATLVGVAGPVTVSIVTVVRASRRGRASAVGFPPPARHG